MRMLLLCNVGFLPVHFPLLHILRNAVHGVKILEVLRHSFDVLKVHTCRLIADMVSLVMQGLVSLIGNDGRQNQKHRKQG